jgi:large subunit ribosomal protein L31e
MADEGEEEERIIVVPLRKLQYVPRTQRAPRAVKMVKQHVAKHMKADLENVWMYWDLNEAIWARGREKPPNKIRVKAIKFEDGLVEVSLPEESKKSRDEDSEKEKPGKRGAKKGKAVEETITEEASKEEKPKEK